jgi:transcription elongation factor/antiterminator RfaH
MPWYVVHTQARAEMRAHWHLENQGFRCFLPHIRTLRRHARRAETVQAPLFPRYLFVSFELHDSKWRSINGTRGVVGVLSNGPHPLAVRDGTVEALVQRCDEAGVVPLTALDIFTTGAKVTITTGAFIGQVGVVANISSADRIAVLLNFMGTRTCVHLPPWHIEAA